MLRVLFSTAAPRCSHRSAQAGLPSSPAGLSMIHTSLIVLCCAAANGRMRSYEGRSGVRVVILGSDVKR